MRKVFMIIIINVIGLLALYGCGNNVEDKTVKETKKQETSVGLPVNSNYLYRLGSHFVKITINTPNQWAVKTEKMDYSKKMTIKELKKDRSGSKLIQFIAKETIDASDVFFVTDRPEGTNYYLVMDGEDFYLALDPGSSEIDIKEHAKYVNAKFVKQ
ncbi:hypothetical protein [Enterococcus faecalis]|uniref:hypothetical protein n=1 Tax=Enterococcus faecalis TaxID=1351 RepID=UPI00045AE9EB|nr:hypothetical protein [Enterococcus faecalis]KAJ61000.1 hypothetical protein P785_1774 [Enterococcus faecalis KS19]